MSIEETRKTFEATLRTFYASLPKERQQVLIAERLAEYDKVTQPPQQSAIVDTKTRVTLLPQ